MICEESKKLSFRDNLYRINAIAFAAVYLANSFLDSRILFYVNAILIIAILSKSIPLLPATFKVRKNSGKYSRLT